MALGLFQIISAGSIGGSPERFVLTVSSSANMAVDDHIGTRLDDTTNSGAIYRISSINTDTSITVTDDLIEFEGSGFGLPATGLAGFGTPEVNNNYTQLPYGAPGWDAMYRRNTRLTDDAASGIVGPAGPAGADGAVGPAGPAGPAGADGSSIADVTLAEVLANGNTTSSGSGTLSSDLVISAADRIASENGSALTLDAGFGGSDPLNTIEFNIEGTTVWRIGNNGDLIAETDNAYDIGNGDGTAPGENRPRKIFVGTEVIVADNLSIGATSIAHSSTLTVSAGSSSDLIFQARGGSVTLNEVGETTLVPDTTFSATSIIGAINELRTEMGNVSSTLNDAYIAGNVVTTSAGDGNVIIAGTEALQVTAASGLDVDTLIDFDGTTAAFDASGTISFDAGAASNFTTTSGLLTLAGFDGVLFSSGGSGKWRIDESGDFIAEIDNTYDIGNGDGTSPGENRPRKVFVGTEVVIGDTIYIDTNSITASAGLTLTAEVTTAGSDIIFEARGGSITLNEDGEESLDATVFTATSIIGALNEIGAGGIGGGGAGTLAATLVLGNTTGGNDIVVSSGDVITIGVAADVGLTYGTNTITATSATTVATNGESITITAGSGNTTGTGGTVNLTAGTGGATGAGGVININGGTSTSTSSGGQVSITGGPNNSGGSGQAGSVSISGGNTNGSGPPGSVGINGGIATGSTTGGVVNITGGLGIGASLGGGNVTISGGDNSTGAAGFGGSVTIRGGNDSFGDGGSVIIQGRNAGATAGLGGTITLTGGQAGASGTAGAITITAGAGGSTSGIGGALNLNAGSATAGNSNGGALTLAGGTATGSGAAGDIIFKTAGSNRWRFNEFGDFIAETDNTYDIGNGDGTAPGENRPRKVFVGTEVIIGDTIYIDTNSITGSEGLTFTAEVATAGSDITFEARGGSITLNEEGEESLDITVFTATSIIGALNELGAGGIGGGGSSQTLAQTLALGNTTSGNDIVVSTGDVVTVGVAADVGITIASGGITGTTATSSNTAGQGITLTGGTGQGNGIGGAIAIVAGQGGSTSTGGAVTIDAGTGGSSSGNGGNVTITSGIPIGSNRDAGDIFINGANASNAFGDGGDVSISGGNAQNASFVGQSGIVNISGGSAAGSGSAGRVELNGGSALGSGSGGSILLTAGTSVSGPGGSITLQGRNAGGSSSSGGTVTLSAGAGGSSGGLAGTISINGGPGGSSNGAGGNVDINAGSATAGNSNGGDVNIAAGTATGSGVAGDIIFNTDNSNRWRVTEFGDFIAEVDNLYDIGNDAGTETTPAANRPRKIFVGTEIVVGNTVYIDAQNSIITVGNGATGTGQISVGEEFGTLANIHHIETELTGLSGATATATSLIPDGALIISVATRVTTTITGATTFDIGDGSDVDRWGAAIALTSGTTTDPTDFTDNTLSYQTGGAGNVVLTANGSSFTGGAVRIVLTYMTITAPTS